MLLLIGNELQNKNLYKINLLKYRRTNDKTPLGVSWKIKFAATWNSSSRTLQSGNLGLDEFIKEKILTFSRRGFVGNQKKMGNCTNLNLNKIAM